MVDVVGVEPCGAKSFMNMFSDPGHFDFTTVINRTVSRAFAYPYRSRVETVLVRYVCDTVRFATVAKPIFAL